MAGLRRLLEAGGAKVYTNGTKYTGSIYNVMYVSGSPCAEYRHLKYRTHSLNLA